MLTVTTSWDDGDVLDKRVAEILEKNGLKGTFYIPKEYWGSRLSDEEIRTLSKRHEIGGHTLSHVELSKLSPGQAKAEITGSKKWLEEVCGKEISMFCYPRGKYTEETKKIVAEAGFRGARTTKVFSLELGDPYAIATTVHVYPFPFRHGAGIKEFFAPLLQRLTGFRSLGVPMSACTSFERVAIAAFEESRRRGGVFHLWGHSWEVERFGLWREFENVCAHIGKRPDCTYVTNGELV